MEKSDKRKVTIYNIAEACGVSTATVSLVLHNDPRVKESTRNSILECITRLNYQPSFLASSLASQRTCNIGLVIPNLKNPVFAEMVDGIEAYLQNQDHNVIIGVTNQKLEKEKHYLNYLYTQRIDGLILFPTYLDEIRNDLIEMQNKGLPLVICGVRAEGLNSIDYVSSNVVEGAYMATESLIKKGHKNICFVSGAINQSQSDERIKGYKRALGVYDISFNDEYILQTLPDLDVVRKSCYYFLESHPEVTAFFCLYDFIAFSVMKAVYDRGLRIPEDISVVGYDDIALNKYLPVELSSVNTNSYKVGETAARMVINRLRNPQAEVQRIVLPPHLVERSSSSLILHTTENQIADKLIFYNK